MLTLRKRTQTQGAPARGGGGGELGSLFVLTILAIVTSRREKRATSRSFRKWRDQNNPFFQRFSTSFDVLTTNTSPLDPV